MKDRLQWIRAKKLWAFMILPLTIIIALILVSTFIFPILYSNNSSGSHGNNAPPSGNASMIQMSGNVPYLISNSSYSSDSAKVGNAPTNQVLNLALYLNFTHIWLLKWYANEVNNPSSIFFHKYLNPQEFRDIFYPTQYEISLIENYYIKQGFSVWSYPYAPTVIVIRGNIGLIEKTFHVVEYEYRFSGNNAVFLTNTANPWIPTEFLPEIFHVYGLSYASYALYTQGPTFSLKRELRVENPQINVSGNSCTLTPRNIYSYYGLNKIFKKGFSGAGTKIGILGVGESIGMNSVTDFWYTYNISNPNTNLINLTVGGTNNYAQGFEADLDLEWAGAMAPNATIYDVMQPFNLTGIGNNAVNFELYYMLNVVDPNVVTGSWGELQFHHDRGFAEIYNNIGLQAVVEGISIFLATGDSHNLGYLTVMDSRYIIGVGGIYPLLNSSGSIMRQYAWNNPTQYWYGGPLGSGGGSSFFYRMPSYQRNGLIKVNGINNHRGLPDIAMPASELVVFANRSIFDGSGTSFATPIVAGMFASIESAMNGTGNGSGRLGWIQPVLYNLGYGKTYGYEAYLNASYLQPGSWTNAGQYLGAGWNQYTGIGGINSYNLYMDIKEYFSVHAFFPGMPSGVGPDGIIGGSIRIS